MESFEFQTLAILGRQPALGLAELESLYGSENLKPAGSGALIKLPVSHLDFKRLGGTVKLARILNVLPTINWKNIEQYLAANIPKHLEYVPPGSFTLGLSVYGLPVPAKTIGQSLMGFKRLIRASQRSVRIVPNKQPALSSAQVLHNKLTTKGAWELLLLKDGGRTILAQTLFVQDIDAYVARDQARPKRDARVGMLPPKLAQIIINLVGPAPLGLNLLDPFCGTGVLLQEALLMSYDVIGTDIDKRMVSYTKENLDWLYEKYDVDYGGPLSMQYELETADATKHQWRQKIDVVASEIYLGKPVKTLPSGIELQKIVTEVNDLVEKFLKNLSSQIKSGTSLSLAVPAWRKPNSDLICLPLLDEITDIGYNYRDLKHVRRENLIYFREDQTVARQLLRIKKV